MDRQNITLYVSLVLLVLGSFLTLFLGEIPWNEVWSGAQARLFNNSTIWNPLLDERLPRLIVIICTGASLAVSGVVMQALFQNPLASPSVLGISAGGCLLVAIVFIMNWHQLHPYALPVAAVAGCFFTLCLVCLLSSYQEGNQMTNLILTGIAISTLLISIQGILLYALRDHWQLIQTITEWEAGSTYDRHWQHVHMQLPLTIVGLIGCLFYRKELNLLALGEEEARNLGVDVEKVRWRLFLSVSLLTGGALAGMGMIAFFGLILPHLLRQLQGANLQSLMPLCMIAGAAVLTIFDLILRSFGVHIISVGHFIAIIGGAFFLYLLMRTQQRRWAT